MTGDLFTLPEITNLNLFAVFLVSIRLGALLLLTPLLYAASLPASARTILIVTLSFVLSLGLANEYGVVPIQNYANAGQLFTAAITELALGMTLSLGIFVAFAAISVAGRLLDIQIGFGIAQIFDPLSRAQVPILTAALNQIGVVYFFLIDAHHTMLRAFSYSLEHFPPGQAWALEATVDAVLKQVAGLFSLGFTLAAPVVFCVLLVELALGVLSRNLPQMNMFVMGVPVKIIVGLVALSCWFVGMGHVMTRLHGATFELWNAVFLVPGPVLLQGGNGG